MQTYLNELAPKFSQSALTKVRVYFNGNLVYMPELRGRSQALRGLVTGNRFAVLAVMQSADVFNMGSNLFLI